MAEGQKTHMRTGGRLVEGWGAQNREKKYWKNKRRGKKESGISRYEVPIRGKKVRTISLKT